MRISDFWISGQSLIQENCQNSRASNDIDMKLGPVNKLYKRSMETSKKIDDDVMPGNCVAIIIFSNLWPIWSILETGFQTYDL